MATENAIIFINNYDSPKKSRLKNLTCYQHIKLHFSVKLHELPKRVFSSFMPPFCGQKYQKIHVDLLGPLLAILTLVILLHYGHNSKKPWAVSKLSPTDSLLGYVLTVPILTYLFCKIAQSSISFIEIVSILGYSLYGHIITLVISLVLYNEEEKETNFVFFVCFVVFGGLSTLRIIVILVACIPRPALRLITCSFVSIVQLLFLVLLHFLYVHKRFVYGSRNKF